MRLLERLKRYREMRRLRADVRRRPSPRAFAALAERFVAHGDLDSALRVAERGLGRYPDSERLQLVRTFTKRKSLGGRIRRLRTEIARRPTPFAYTSLAEIHRELGDDDEALDLALACAQEFPLNAQPLLVQGEIRLERFLRDLVAQDAIHAEAALQRALRLSSASVKARLLLAELYHLVGAVADCRRQLRSVLEERGADESLRSFLDELGEGTWDGELEELTPAAFATLARSVEEAGAFVGDPTAFPSLVQHGTATRCGTRMHVDWEGLARDVAGAGATAGMRNTVLLGPDGEILAEHTSDAGLPGDAFADAVRHLRETADETSRRMDAGALVRAELEGPAGDVTVLRIQRLTVGALYSEPLRADRVWEMLQDVTARNVTREPEVARA